MNSKNKNVKFKLFWFKKDAFLFLKVLYFSCYDIEKIALDLFFCKSIKKKFNKYLVILYQALGHICNLVIYIIFIITVKDNLLPPDSL